MAKRKRRPSLQTRYLFDDTPQQKARDKRPQHDHPKQAKPAPDQEPAQPTEVDPELVEQILNSSVDAWVTMPGKPTLTIDSPHGRFYMACSRPAYDRLVAAGEVVFSPAEVKRFCAANHAYTDKYPGPGVVEAIIQMKKMDPAAKIEGIKVFK